MTAARRPTRSEFAHAVRIAVRWGDMDSLGHVNNAKFFTYDEQTRLQYLEAFAPLVPDLWSGQGVILAKLGCDFLQQLRYPATVDAAFRIARLGRTSLGTECALFEGERLVATLEGVLVWFDYRAQKAIAIPEPVRQCIREREVIAPIEA